MSGLRIVGSYFRTNWVIYLLGIAMVAAGSLLAAQIPSLLGRVTDSLRDGKLGMSEMMLTALSQDYTKHQIIT